MANEDYTAKNRKRLIAFFESGAKRAAELGNLGVEVEHFVVANDGTPISYEPTDANVGIRNVLDHIFPAGIRTRRSTPATTCSGSLARTVP